MQAMESSEGQVSEEASWLQVDRTVELLANLCMTMQWTGPVSCHEKTSCQQVTFWETVKSW